MCVDKKKSVPTNYLCFIILIRNCVMKKCFLWIIPPTFLARYNNYINLFLPWRLNNNLLSLQRKTLKSLAGQRKKEVLWWIDTTKQNTCMSIFYICWSYRKVKLVPDSNCCHFQTLYKQVYKYQFNIYLYKYENVCLSVCSRFFPAIWKPIAIPFGTMLPFAPEKVLTQ